MTYTVLLEDHGKGGLFDRWLVFHDEKFEHLSVKEVLDKIKEFTEKHPDYQIETPMSHELMYMSAKGYKSDIYHTLRVKSEP